MRTAYALVGLIVGLLFNQAVHRSTRGNRSELTGDDEKRLTAERRFQPDRTGRCFEPPRDFVAQDYYDL